MTPCLAHRAARCAIVVLASLRRRVRVGGPKKPSDRHARARQVPVRTRHRGAQQEELARRARVLQAAHRHLPAEPVSRRTRSSASATRTSAKAPPKSLVLAINEFREFLSFYPTNQRADYAQYKLGMAHFNQMRAPERDQTETREAITEFQTFVARYPEQPADRPKARSSCARRKDRLERGRVPRRLLLLPREVVSRRDRPLQDVLKNDPEYTSRDARLLLPRRVADQDVKQPAEALPYYERLVEGIREERIPRAGAEADRGAEGRDAGRNPRRLEMERTRMLAGPRRADRAGPDGRPDARSRHRARGRRCENSPAVRHAAAGLRARGGLDRAGHAAAHHRRARTRRPAPVRPRRLAGHQRRHRRRACSRAASTSSGGSCTISSRR